MNTTIEEIEKRWNNPYLTDADGASEDIYFLIQQVRSLEADLAKERERVKELEAEAIESLEVWKAQQSNSNSQFSHIEVLDSRIKELEEGIGNVPTGEYGEAQREGCDSNGAWDCFIEALIKWENKLVEK